MNSNILIPIPKNLQSALKSEKANYSLYFERMNAWKDKPKDDLSDFRLKDDLRTGAESAIRKLQKKAKNLLSNSSSLLENLHKRQDNFLYSLEKQGRQVFHFTAKLSTPFISGLGAGHPSETGIILDRNTGLPYIPATGLKGVLRLSLALYLAEKDEKRIKDPDTIPYIDDKEPEMRRFFGDTDTKENAVRGQIVLLDAFPKEVPELKLDIMTPHYGKYYTDSGDLPLENDNPNPIAFISVKESSQFIFRAFVLPLEENSKKDLSWQEEDGEIFRNILKKALGDIGVGAKTAVGYGRFTDIKDTWDLLMTSRKEAEEKKADKEKQLAEKKAKQEQAEREKLEAEERQKAAKEEEEQETTQIQSIKAEAQKRLEALAQLEDSKTDKNVERLKKYYGAIIKEIEHKPMNSQQAESFANNILLKPSSEEEKDALHLFAAEKILEALKNDKKFRRSSTVVEVQNWLHDNKR